MEKTTGNLGYKQHVYQLLVEGQLTIIFDTEREAYDYSREHYPDRQTLIIPSAIYKYKPKENGATLAR